MNVYEINRSSSIAEALTYIFPGIDFSGFQYTKDNKISKHWKLLEEIYERASCVSELILEISKFGSDRNDSDYTFKKLLPFENNSLETWKKS